MNRHTPPLLLSAALVLSCAACTAAPQAGPQETPAVSAPSSPAPAGDGAVEVLLSDSGVTVDGVPAGADGAVRVGNEIIYYQDGTDDTYGEGEDWEKHSAQEAAGHTVVTISQPGTYRISGTLSRGQLFVDLGEGAQEDPAAVVTLILDGVDITCTVAPAVFFYRVYECGEADESAAGPDVDTSAAGANVILAAGSENRVTGSHVARIYQEGTTKKLHKYDGAFYSRMSMNIDGDSGDDSGVLSIVSDNEGLDAELHLTVNGGTITIESQDDGINTNEDGISVTTINGGSVTVNAGLGSEGDGIDSNGYLTINGGTVWSMSNDRSPDGGIDADGAITINGGTVYAFGTRNDAADSASAQPYMELSFASTLPAGSQISLTDESGTVLLEAATQKACQSITLSAPALELDTVYHLFVDGVQQQYTGTQAGGFGGGRFGGFGMGGGTAPSGPQRPDGGRGDLDPADLPEDFDPAEQRPGGGPMGRPPEGMEGMTPPDGAEGMAPPEGDGAVPPGGFGGGQQTPPGGASDGASPDGAASGEEQVDFVLTETGKSFSGVCDSQTSGKTRVTFTVDGLDRSKTPEIRAVTSSVDGLADDQIQITVTDSPSEDYAESCLLSDGLDAVNALLPGDPGDYVLTVAVVSSNADYTGAVQIPFTIPEAAESQT